MKGSRQGKVDVKGSGFMLYSLKTLQFRGYVQGRALGLKRFPRHRMAARESEDDFRVEAAGKASNNMGP